jgi:hypothetical protein
MTREWLLEHKFCVACQTQPAQNNQIFCKNCFRRMLTADASAMKGLSSELAKHKH